MDAPWPRADRRLHALEVERAPARAHVLVGPDEVARCRRVHRSAWPRGRRDRPRVRHAATADAHHAAADRRRRQRASTASASIATAEHQQREAAAQMLEQPRAARAVDRRIGGGRARHHRARPKSSRRRACSAPSREHGRHREAAAVDERARKRWRRASCQHRVAKRPRDRALRRDEVGGARGVAKVLVGRGHALAVVACRAALGRAPARRTSASFQPRLSASCTPLFAPRAPNGLTRCAASPAKSKRP